jgi:hypothetical protein
MCNQRARIGSVPDPQRDYLRPQLCDFGYSCIYQRVGSVNSGGHAARCAARNEGGTFVAHPAGMAGLATNELSTFRMNSVAAFLALKSDHLDGRRRGASPRSRSRIPLHGEPGALNAITDVAGVEVGHKTLIEGSGELRVGTGPVRTGVTVVLPRGRSSTTPVFAGWSTLNRVLDMGSDQPDLPCHSRFTQGSTSSAKRSCYE